MDVLELKNHGNKICEFLSQQYENDSLCDIVINTSDGKQVRAHKVVLATFSEFFHQKIKSHHHRSSSTSVVLNVDHNLSCMKTLIDFMYKGKLNVKEEEKANLYAAAVNLYISSAQSLLLQAYSISSLSLNNKWYETPDTSKHSDESDPSSQLEKQNGGQTKLIQNETKTKKKSLRKNSKPLRRINKTQQIQAISIPTLKIKIEKTDDSDYVTVDQANGNDIDHDQDDNESDDDDDDIMSDPDYTFPSKKLSKKNMKREKRTDMVKSKDTKTKLKDTKHRKKISRKIFIPCSMEKLCCQLCRKKFKSYSSMNRHLALKHDKIGTRNYLSHIIAKKYMMRQQYLKFIYSKNNAKNFRCNKCMKKFAYYSTLCSHVTKNYLRKASSLTKSVFRKIMKFIAMKNKFYHPILKEKKSKLKERSKKKKTSRVQCCLCLSYLSCDRHLSNHMVKVHKMTNEESAALTGYPKYKKLIGEASIQCLECSDVFSSMKALKLHKRHVHKIKDVVPPCNECGDTFKSVYALKNHLRSIHHKRTTEINGTLGVKVFCEVEGCKFSSPSTHVVNIHVLDNHPGVEYKCGDCGFMCHLKSMRDKHYVTAHLNREKYLKNKCQICDKRFGKKSHCIVHEYLKHGINHPSVKLFKCTFADCDYVCVSKSGLKIHETKHSEEKKFECQFCGTRLKTKTTYTKHINKIHLGIRPHLCQVCGATFGEDSELSAHINNKHSTEKQFQCDYCPYATANKSTFFTHLFMVHKVRAQDDKRREYRCTQCDFVTLLKSRYKTHFNGHKNIREHVCTECGKQFISRSTLVAHKQWTHSSKLHSCNQCEYRTKTVQKLNEHVRVQHQLRGFKPYKCPYCDFTCATGGNCRKHVKQKHKDEEVRYIRDDSLIAAARIARQSGNNTPMIGGDVQSNVVPQTQTSACVVTDTSNTDPNQMMFQHFQSVSYGPGLDLGLQPV